MFVDDELIEQCFANLYRIAKPSTRFFATYLQGRRAERLELKSHPFFSYVHTRRQMLSYGCRYWRARYIGEWNHPRGQMMVEYRPR